MPLEKLSLDNSILEIVSGFLENDIALLKLKEHVLVHRMKSLDVITLPNPHIVGKMWPKTGQVR